MIIKIEEVNEFLRKFCEEKGIAFSKAEDQLHLLAEDFALLCVSNPAAPEPDGLANDIETLMLPTLFIRKDGARLYAEETEYTEKYLLEGKT